MNRKAIIASMLSAMMVLTVSVGPALAESDSGSNSGSNAAAEAAKAQIQQLKKIIEELQGKYKGAKSLEKQAENFEKKVEKFEENIAKKLSRPVQIGPSSANLTDLGNGRIQAHIKNAKIVSVSGNDIQATLFGANFTIRVNSSTKIVREFWGGSTLGEFAPGDLVNAFGYQDPQNPKLMTAETVRNLSITKVTASNRDAVCRQLAVPAKNSATGECNYFAPCNIPSGWTQVQSCAQ